MKRIFISLLCMTAMICSSHAQIVGDMNNDGKLTIEDITTLTNTILGKTAQRTISANGTDQTTLIGSWAAQDGSTINIQSGGKATIKQLSAVTNYEYFPSKGSLVFYNSSNSLVAAYQVKSFTTSCLTLCALGSTTEICYYPKSSYATSVQMNRKTLNLLLNNTYNLVLIPIPTTAHLYNTTWKSSNYSVATVSESGVVTAKAVGTAIISATSDYFVANCTVTVTQPVESVTLPYSTLTLPCNASFTIDAIVTPSYATNKTLAWSSLNTNIATVSNGTVTTGSTSGRTLIIAKTTDGTNLSDTCEVRVRNVSPTGLTLSKTTASLAPNGTLTLTATITPATASGLSVVWSSSDESIATVDQTGKVTAKQRGGTAKIIATIAGTNISKSCAVTVDDSNMYVDLDLPSKTLWATMNVGAESPEGYGNYYAWGETKAYGEEDASNTNITKHLKTTYNWMSYKWGNGAISIINSLALTKYNTDSKYGTVDDNTILDSDDDAAYVNWGPNWRMPTKAEWVELIDNCTWKWTTINDINGYMVTSKKNTSKSIFLPVTGYREDNMRFGADSHGNYWSSSISESVNAPYNACCLEFYSDKTVMRSSYRCYGLNIRAVRNK